MRKGADPQKFFNVGESFNIIHSKIFIEFEITTKTYNILQT
jgi:hypothetical protein